MTIAAGLFGTYTAIATPFNEDASALDLKSLEKLLEFQLKGGVQGVVACGSTGEAATLTDEEYRQVVSLSVNFWKGKGTVIAGVGANSTRRAIEIAQVAEGLGADALLLVTPFYNKPSQDGLLVHFREVKRNTRLPIIAYNVPGRTGVNLMPPTVAKLVSEGLIIGVKDACGSMDQMLDTLALVRGKTAYLSGEDSLVHPAMCAGGQGVISATANIIPEIFHRLTESARKGDVEAGAQAQFDALPIVRAMFVESNPVPVKAALAMKGIIKFATPRLPLLSAQPSTCEKIKAVLGL